MYIRHNSIYPNHHELLIPENYYLEEIVTKGRPEYVLTKRNVKK